MYQYTITDTTRRVKKSERRMDVINYYLAEQIGKDRLDEARAMAAQARLMASARPTPDPLRVALGLALIRVGRALAGQAAKSTTGPRRVTA
jgi:hypothetical protein